MQLNFTTTVFEKELISLAGTEEYTVGHEVRITSSSLKYAPVSIPPVHPTLKVHNKL